MAYEKLHIYSCHKYTNADFLSFELKLISRLDLKLPCTGIFDYLSVYLYLTTNEFDELA